MSKKISLFLIPVIAITLAACSAPKSDMYIENGAYNLTPQEYVDRINEVVEAQGDSRYTPIPEFQKSGDEIEIDFIYLTVEITTNDSGNITEIYYTWDGTRRGIGDNLSLYLGYTFELLGISDSSTVYETLDMMDYTYTAYETTYTENGTLFSYRMMGNGQFNYLTIEPSET